ncbi:coiled-coil domain-containing protein 189 isoform X1 [Lagopus leucura]|uniref:coiled-coil domain-containing protein 189 isoform X1 n=2 Tax=Lagopus leucura TaxID=30410 RepID=UPI001C679134|nr:coiled-coil domain-containing protein 189 isoform X1 [Lagopus leucura]
MCPSLPRMVPAMLGLPRSWTWAWAVALIVPVLTALFFLSQPDSCETGIRPWTDLDVVVMERLQAAPTQQDRRVVLAEVLPGPPVLLDAYEAAVELGQELELAPGPLSALLRIVRCAITMCTQTPLPDVEECYAYFSKLLLCHAVHHPPVSVAVFGLTQVARIAAHLFGTVLRHAKLYAYVLTPQACLDLTLVYVDSPEHGPEGQMPTTLPEEQGETTGNPSTEPLLQEAAVPELMQVPAEMHLSKEDVSVSPRASPRGKKHLRRPRGSRQGNKRP